jgi:hypothetical protein
VLEDRCWNHFFFVGPGYGGIGHTRWGGYPGCWGPVRGAAQSFMTRDVTPWVFFLLEQFFSKDHLMTTRHMGMQMRVPHKWDND